MTPDTLVIITPEQLLKKTLWPIFDNKLRTTLVVKDSSVSKWSSRTTANSCACYILTVSALLFFLSRSPKDGAHKAELRAPGNTLHNCIFSSRPLSITLVVRHTRTQLLSLLPLYSSALAFPTTSFLSHPQKCYCTIYWHVRLFCVFFSLQNHFIFRLDSYYFHEIPTAKFSWSSSELSLWQTEQTDTKPFLFSCSSWSRSFQGPSGGIQVKSLTVELCVHESLMWADIMAVWATGSDVRSANYAAVLFLIAARSPFSFFFLWL